MEYPKRLYRGGKGYTVNSLEEEEKFLTSPVKTLEVPSIVEEKIEEPSEENKTEVAIEYLVSLGYNKASAKRIIKNEGLEEVLRSKAEGKDPQE